MSHESYIINITRMWEGEDEAGEAVAGEAAAGEDGEDDEGGWGEEEGEYEGNDAASSR